MIWPQLHPSWPLSTDYIYRYNFCRLFCIQVGDEQLSLDVLSTQREVEVFL